VIRTSVALAAAVGLALSGAPGAAAQAASATDAAAVTFKAAANPVARGELLRLSGVVKAADRGLADETVRIQRRHGSDWSTVATAETSTKGVFSHWISIERPGVYRAVTDSSLRGRSPALHIRTTVAHRTLEQRAEELARAFGSLRGAQHSLTKRERAASKARRATSIIYRKLGSGLLVQVATASRTRTWLVKGAILKAYLKRGGPTGELGVPIQDPRCALPDGGCLQTFTRGTLYSRPGKTASTSAKGAPGDMIAVARTQVGFRQKGQRAGPRVITKYQIWAGSGEAWCSIFLAWVANRAGHPDAVKKHTHFSIYRSWARSSLKRLKHPRVGAIMVLDGSAPLSHAAMVSKVHASGKKITVIDGNWNMHVNERTTAVAGSMEFYWPY
jgi:uncharacterized protein (TIGR02594 family)